VYAHSVFVTKYRHTVFSDRHLTRLGEIMRAVCADFETEPAEFNGKANHIHLLVNFPPKVAVSKLVNSLKGVSSRRMRQEFPEPTRHHWRAQRLWSGSHFAGSVGGATISVLRLYIEQQDRAIKDTPGRDRPPARAFTTGVKPGALARTSVVVSRARRPCPCRAVSPCTSRRRRRRARRRP
jgi:putative transposase